MFKEQYKRNWAMIANSEPKPTLRYNRAVIILKSLGKEAHIKRNYGYFRVFAQLKP